MNTNDELYRVIRAKDFLKLRALLEAGADPNNYSPHFKHTTPMRDAAERDLTEGMGILCAFGGNVNARSDDQGTPLMGAAMMGHTAAGLWLLNHGADAKAENVFHQTALSLALMNLGFEFADMLLEHKPELQGAYLQETARAIVHAQDPWIMSWLLQAGITPDLVDADGQPWLLAVQKRKLKVNSQLVDILLSAGANVNAQDESGATALHFALSNEDLPSFMSLLRADANPDVPDRDGSTVRMLLAEWGPDELRAALNGWEASCKAHQAIQASPGQAGLRHL